MLLHKGQQIVGQRHLCAVKCSGRSGFIGVNSPENIQMRHTQRAQTQPAKPAGVVQHAAGEGHRVVGQKLPGCVDMLRDAEGQ